MQQEPLCVLGNRQRLQTASDAIWKQFVAVDAQQNSRASFQRFKNAFSLNVFFASANEFLCEKPTPRNKALLLIRGNYISGNAKADLRGRLKMTSTFSCINFILNFNFGS